MPSTSLSRLDAKLPVIVVKSMVAVATVKIPPPAPMLKGLGAAISPGSRGAVGAVRAAAQAGSRGAARFPARLPWRPAPGLT